MTARRSARPLISLTLAAAVLAACGASGAPGATSAPGGTASTGGLPTGIAVTDLTRLCDLVGPGDFATAGIAGAAAPTVDSDGPGSAYCVYAGTSAGTGGIEFDAFAGDNGADTYQTIIDELGALTAVNVSGADEAVGTDGVAGQADAPASIVVRKGNLVFALGTPGGVGMRAKLESLAALVLSRGSGLTG